MSDDHGRSSELASAISASYQRALGLTLSACRRSQAILRLDDCVRGKGAGITLASSP